MYHFFLFKYKYGLQLPTFCSLIMKETIKELQLRKIEKNKEIYYSKTLKLGQGAFGEVFLGFDQSLHSPFACKIISVEKINLQQNQQALIKKIKDQIINMQLAKNQHIVQFFQAKSSDRHIYILCEYCNGSNLDSYIKSRGYLTQNQVMVFFKEILKGFQSLRERNIVHRDMKPANLLMHNYYLKIADLGFSKCIENHQPMESIVGTPLYMSPQIFERVKYTEKTDIWSLGAILYEMLYGKNPFSGCMTILQLKERVKKEIQFPIYPYVSEDTKQLIKGTMLVDEKDRIDWQYLFQKYLKMSIPIQKPAMNNLIFHFEQKTQQYFRDTYFIQSHLHLHKVLIGAQICSEQQIKSIYPFYQTTQQYFTQIRFLIQYKTLIDEYYKFFLQKRNQISYLMILCDKINKLIPQINNEIYTTISYCLNLLILKYSITLLDQMLIAEDKLGVYDKKYQNLYGKFCYDKLLIAIFRKDKETFHMEHNRFIPYFQTLVKYLQINNRDLFSMIQNNLSGIYSSKQGQKRVIKFFLGNYLKKIHNFLKQQAVHEKTRKSSEIISEQQQLLRNSQHIQPSPRIIIMRLSQTYLTNHQLFNLSIQVGNHKAINFRATTFKKNLNQVLYDCQTSYEESYYENLLVQQPFQEESVISFMSKEIKWNSIFMPKLL